MTKHPYSTPNGHDDLQPERGTDATTADALDALLNEIAQEQGFPDTRPGSRQQRPDVRTDRNAPTGEPEELAALATGH